MKETKKIYASYYHPSFSWHKLLRKISFTSNNFGDPYTIDLSDGVKVMVFNATFNNISVISWLSILFVDLPNGMNMLMKIYHACLQQLKQNKIMF
jgi:hypothetical protein